MLISYETRLVADAQRRDLRIKMRSMPPLFVPENEAWRSRIAAGFYEFPSIGATAAARVALARARSSIEAAWRWRVDDMFRTCTSPHRSRCTH